MVERFTRADENTINWQVMIEDPDVYTAPWTVEIPFRRRTDYIIYEYAPTYRESRSRIWNLLG